MGETGAFDGVASPAMSLPSGRRPRPPARRPLFWYLCLGAAVILGCFLLVAKITAPEGPPSRAGGHGHGVRLQISTVEAAPAKGAGSAAPGASATPGAAPAPAAPAAAAPAHGAPAGRTVTVTLGVSDAGAAAPAEEHGKEEEEETAPALKTAVLEGDSGVPIHTTGTYRSPFANPGFGEKPARAKVGFLLSNVRNYDIKEGTFEADFNISLTSNRPMPKVDLQPTNGKFDNKEVLADLPTFKLWRIVGNFSSPADLHDYPFDTQELAIELEDDSNGIDSLRLAADQSHSNLDVGFQVPGWDVSYIEARTLNHYYPDRFENDDLYYSSYIFRLGIKRFASSAAFTVFVPAFVIVLISLIGMWLPKDELEVRSNAGAPMLAAAVLFHFTLTQALPATAYLTRADKLMMAVYISLLLNMFATWFWFIFDDRHEDRIFKLGRAIVPPLTFAIMAAGSWL